jgi:hypothetical protein
MVRTPLTEGSPLRVPGRVGKQQRHLGRVFFFFSGRERRRESKGLPPSRQRKREGLFGVRWTNSPRAGATELLVEAMRRLWQKAGPYVLMVYSDKFRWAVWLRLRSAVRERARQAAYSGPGTQGASIDLDVPLSPPFTTKATDSRTHAKQSGGLLDSDALTGQYSQTRVQRRERRRPPK